MPQEKNCIFCSGPIEEGQICAWCGFDQTPGEVIPGTLPFGTKLNIYVTGDVITMDGESTAYWAYDTKNEATVIIKEFLPVSMVAPRDGMSVAVQRGKEVLFKNLMMDFADLYNSLAKVQSKAVQKVISVFHRNNTVYAVLEHVKGDSLGQNLIKRGKPYTFKEARWLFQDLFMLMKELEQHNIAHGGISDETVIVTVENNIVLTGFSIADLRVKNEHIVYKLYDGFSAPEQYVPNGFFGFYSDIFSVAVLFNYAVTGRTWQENMFSSKLTDRHIPKYASEALRHATVTEVSQRIDNIEDFVLMLDGKRAVEKIKSKKSRKSIRPNNLSQILPYVAVVMVLALFAGAVLSVNNGGQITDTSSQSQDISSQPVEISVPDFVGESYSRVMKNPQYTNDFYFYVEEEYSTEFKLGQIISHSPSQGQKVKPGTLIYLTVSKGTPLLTVPKGLEGMPLSQAEAILNGMGIKYTVLEKVQTRQYPYNTVQGTDKMPGTTIDPRKEFLVVYVSDNTPVQ